MKEYFSWWNVPFDFLFQSWNVTTVTALLFTAIGVFCLSFFYESLRVVIAASHKYFFSLPLIVYTSSAVDATSVRVTDSINYVRSNRIKDHILQTAIHAVKVLFGYLMMLAVMTYNGYIAIAVFAGATFGYYIFGYRVNLAHALKTNCTSSAVSTITSRTNVDSNDEATKPLTEEGRLVVA